MRSADLKNIIVNHAPNHHSKNPGWEYFPSSQIKQQAEIAKQKELIKPSPPSIKIKTLELKAKYTDKTKPKHIFKKTDLKVIAKQKRESLQQWITEENNLRKGIQKPHKCKPAPEQKQEEPNDLWPDMNENQDVPPEEEEQDEQQNSNNDEQEQISQKQKSINEEDCEQDNQDEDQEEKEAPEELEQENQINQDEDYNNGDFENEDQNENVSQNKSENSQNEQQIENQSQRLKNSNSIRESVKQASIKNSEEILENKSEVKSEVSNSFVKNQSKMINKSINTSSVIGYKSQFADQMRSLMDEFE